MNRLTHLALALALAGCFDSDTGPTADSETGETETGDGDAGTDETGDATSGETGGGSGSGDGDGEAEAGALVSVCVVLNSTECRLDLFGDPCLATEEDACDAPAWRPRACYLPGGPCLGLFPGEECPTGWVDACEYFDP